MKKWLPLVLIGAMFAIAGTQYVLQLAPAAVVKVEGLSPWEIHDVMGLDAAEWHQSSGLDVVGINSSVYLSVAEAAGEEITAATWTVEGPAGFTAVLTEFPGEAGWMTFRPDVAGTYTVSADITTASGTGAGSVTVTAGEYVGVGGLAGASPDFVAGQCAGCHSGTFADWAATDHSTFFTLSLDGMKSSHYNEGCIECHTVGYDLTATNGGFDDVQATVGWTWPDSLAEGNWQDMVDNFAPLAQFSQIQCESCHGPGSLHKGNTETIQVAVGEQVCGQCHEDGHYHRRNTMWKASAHGNLASRGFSYAGGRSGCADCHSTWGFIAKVDPASNHDQVTGGAEGIACAACHDPHDVTNEDQLRRIDTVELGDGTEVSWGGLGRLCMNCHIGRRDANEYSKEFHNHFGPHYSNQTDMLAGANVNTFGRYLPSSTHRDAIQDTCVGCHMTATPGSGEPGRDMLGDHSWAMHATLDDGTSLDHVAACVDCHGDIDSFEDIMAREDFDGDGEIEAATDEIKGLMDEVAMLLPPIGEPTVEVTDEFTSVELQAAFNYFFVEDDGTHGLHNFQFAANLLLLSKDVLEFGVLVEGSMVEITDVPNDQGKQVNVVWTRFGGDGPSDDPVDMYYVWRMDDMAAGKADAPALETMDVSDAPAAVTFDGSYWTAVGSQPAAGMDYYGAVVPTLFDAAADTVMTTFMVSGHTRAGNVVGTLPMDGYSVDNLVPTAPTSLAGSAANVVVSLTWDDAVDEDFSYFAVYRAESAGLDITTMEPVGTTILTTFDDPNVTSGTAYYYQIAAFDFNGNQGDASEEIMVALGTDTEAFGVPTEFALHQAYPNPFNPTTTVEFDVPQTSDVTVVVYDLLGRPIETLVNGSTAPGRHTVQLSAGSWSSGLYIIRMSVADRVFERSVLLVK